MNIILTIKIALRGLFANKVRAFLTVLGIIIGISGIITMVSVGNGAESLIVNQVESIGTNLIGILPGSSGKNEPPAALFGIVVTTLTNEDIEAVSIIPQIVASSTYNNTVEQVSYKNRSTEASLNGVSPGYPVVEDAIIREGRFFNESENNSLARVAVLGHQIKEDLFGDLNPIGERIKIRKQNFRIIGYFDERGVNGFANSDTHIYVPSKTIQKLILGVNHVGFARLKVDKPENADMAVQHVESILRSRHGIQSPQDDDFTVSSQAQGLKIVSNITGSIKLLLTAIAGIALIVGGIGIMNVMYISVTERIHEIGLRKALGAKRKDILRQFLVEAITITGIGGIIGILIGIGFSFLIAISVQQLGYAWDYIITLDSIIIATFAIVGIGIVFGYAPAKRASKKRAIEALRYE